MALPDIKTITSTPFTIPPVLETRKPANLHSGKLFNRIPQKDIILFESPDIGSETDMLDLNLFLQTNAELCLNIIEQAEDREARGIFDNVLRRMADTCLEHQQHFVNIYMRTKLFADDQQILNIANQEINVLGFSVSFKIRQIEEARRRQKLLGLLKRDPVDAKMIGE